MIFILYSRLNACHGVLFDIFSRDASILTKFGAVLFDKFYGFHFGFAEEDIGKLIVADLVGVSQVNKLVEVKQLSHINYDVVFS